MKKNSVENIGGLYYFEDAFSYLGKSAPVIRYFRLGEIERDIQDNVVSAEIEWILEPVNYFKRLEYFSRTETILERNMNFAILGAIQHKKMFG